MSDCRAPNPDDEIKIPDTIGMDFYSPRIAPMAVTSSGRRVRLTWQVSRYNYHATDGIRVRIVASDALLMPIKIFAYLLLPLKPGESERVGAFDHVCSPTDLEEYPEDEPIPDTRPEWFRLDFVDVLLRSRAEVEAFIRDVAEDVQRLKATLDLTDTLLPGGQIWIGDAPSAPPP
jgi:hypothetical protein